MTDYYCENCEFFEDRSTDKLIDGFCEKYNQSLTFYNWWEKCDKCIIDTLRSENADLHERLKKAIEVPFVFNKKVFVIVHGREGNFYLFEGIVTGIGTDTNKLYEGEIDLLMSVVNECVETHFINGKQYRKQWFCEDEIEYAEARLAELKGGEHE